MIPNIRRFLGAVAIAASAVGTIVGAAQAQDYPHDTVTLVTHSKAGGGTDVFLREMTKYLGPYLGADFVVSELRLELDEDHALDHGRLSSVSAPGGESSHG